MKRIWFITGAGSGIGAGIARAAWKAGDCVVATARNLAKVRNALRDMTDERVAFIELDVTNEAHAKAAVEEALKQFGRIDVAVNNAGYAVMGNFEELPTAAIEQQFATNFWGAAYIMRAVLPVMRKQRSGHIFNISSVAGVVGFKHCSAYGASKFALEGLSLAVANEVETLGIKMTIVEPGFFRTDLLDPHNVKWGNNTIEDYSAEGSTEAMWSPYHGNQQGDPVKLGEALVKLANMENPPRLFVAGGDALNAIAPAIEERLNATRAYEELSKSTEGSYQGVQT